MLLLSPSLSLLLALLVLLGAAPPAAAAMSQALWHRALVSQAQLDAAATSESFQVSSEMLCAALANNAPWCHLLTHEGTTCVLYDVMVDSMYPAAANATTPCRTRHRNVCFLDGEAVPNGAEIQGDCLLMVCRNGTLRPKDIEGAVSTTCDGDFVQETFGCVYVSKDLTDFCTARKFCRQKGGDLAVISLSDFQNLITFLRLKAWGASVWVGVEGDKWYNNQPVDSSMWAPGEPNNDGIACVRMKYAPETDYMLVDSRCHEYYQHLCMRFL